MFLDPAPKRGKDSMYASRILPANRSTEALGDPRQKLRRKPPLRERSPTRNKYQLPNNTAYQAVSAAGRESLSPTVRLVSHSQSPPGSAGSAHEGLSPSVKNVDYGKPSQTAQDLKAARAQPRLSDSTLVQDTSAAESSLQGSWASSQDHSVSESLKPANEVEELDLTPSITLRPSLTHVSPQTQWRGQSLPSGDYSSSSLLQEGDSSTVIHIRGSKRLSEVTTLRSTPTPTELEHRKHAEADERDFSGRAHSLQTLQEASPERSTIRAVPASANSSANDLRQASTSSESSFFRPRSSPAASESEFTPIISRKDSRSRSSPSTVPAPLHIRKPLPPLPQQHVSQESLAESEYSLPEQEPSSPIFVIYGDSDDSRPSRTQPLHYSSFESIESRLDHPAAFQPSAGYSLANSSSCDSFEGSSSTETLPPLHIPKKRLQHQPESRSLSSEPEPEADPEPKEDAEMASEEIDTLPYPRERFSTQLSTIASESGTTSQHLSHFSLGSGILTGDDASSIPLPSSRGRRRRQSAPIDSMGSEAFHSSSPVDSEQNQGDMSLGVFREESAKPQPLFKAKGYDGPLPPIPPIPKSRDSDENFDTVSELQAPSLKTKRSGYSLRQRSNSTPSRNNSHSRNISAASYVDSERGSHGSTLFPIWAKNFYGGTAQLLSSSKISLGSYKGPQRPPHLRNDSQWTERSITSRLGTGYNEIEPDSPASSHFLPSIFRPRTRPRLGTGARSKRSRPSGEDDSRPDSLGIFNNPLPESRNGRPSETLPSGQPKWGALNDMPEEQHPPLPPLPRKYSKQRQWNEMEFPRPMTKDRLSDFAIDNPNLVPTKRASAPLSAWRPPSFSESLGTLVYSRCNRQILLFALGFICPLLWMLASVLPLPNRPISAEDLEKSIGGGSEEDIAAALTKHEAGDAEKRWREEKNWLKARWWRTLNRIMSVVGVMIIVAVIIVAVVLVT
ncbi:hypothetical protein D0861_03509 [Hortaea werneckii]|uniref:Serine-rich protein n=1 Tax=Hortaea werneckii TaxID=91943 RepID=A0A3M7FP91_HORWE|nr:hypothetical protein D0861_03509 [Hortaea werneckii]